MGVVGTWVGVGDVSTGHAKGEVKDHITSHHITSHHITSHPHHITSTLLDHIITSHHITTLHPPLVRQDSILGGLFISHRLPDVSHRRCRLLMCLTASACLCAPPRWAY